MASTMVWLSSDGKICALKWCVYKPVPLLANLVTYTYSFETCRVYNATIPLSSLQVSDLYVVPTRFYESSNEQIWMHVFPHPAYKWLYLWNRIRYEHVTSIRLLLKGRALIWYPI